MPPFLFIRREPTIAKASRHSIKTMRVEVRPLKMPFSSAIERDLRTRFPIIPSRVTRQSQHQGPIPRDTGFRSYRQKALRPLLESQRTESVCPALWSAFCQSGLSEDCGMAPTAMTLAARHDYRCCMLSCTEALEAGACKVLFELVSRTSISTLR